jgi:hypothetical protein
MTSTYLAQVIGLRVESFTKKRGFRGGGPGLAGVGGEFVRDLLIETFVCCGDILIEKSTRQLGIDV